jgi:hypothetical protein
MATPRSNSACTFGSQEVEDHFAELLVLLAGCAACERRGDQASGKQNSP